MCQVTKAANWQNSCRLAVPPKARHTIERCHFYLHSMNSTNSSMRSVIENKTSSWKSDLNLFHLSDIQIPICVIHPGDPSMDLLQSLSNLPTTLTPEIHHNKTFTVSLTGFPTNTLDFAKQKCGFFSKYWSAQTEIQKTVRFHIGNTRMNWHSDFNFVSGQPSSSQVQKYWHSKQALRTNKKLLPS